MLPLDLWRYPRLNPYSLVRPFLFRLDPEKAHRLALKLLEKGLGPKAQKTDDPILNTTVCGLQFRNPVGLAAGFDKNAEVIREVVGFGFGMVEIGTITPKPQAGNPKPRMFRLPEAEGVINRLGFNSDGMDACLRRVVAWHDATTPMRKAMRDKRLYGFVGFNIGMNKDTPNPASCFAYGLRSVAPYADYVTINISSPNTPGLRDLQNHAELSALLKHVMEEREKLANKPPVFVKIAPDLTDTQEADIAQVALSSGIQGLIIGNTTVSRPSGLTTPMAKEVGGLSGRPLFTLSTNMLGRMYKRTEGKIPLIGCGGIMSGADAYAKIRAGASLVQIYSGLVFKGPGLVPTVKCELASLLRRDGFTSVADAVGTGNK